MKKMKKMLVAVLMICVMGVMTACGGMEPEEAKAYTQAVLDAVYLGEFDAYMEQTGATEAEAKEMYEGSIELTLETLGLADLGVSEETEGKYRQVLTDLVKLAKYEIGEVTEKEEDGFNVEIILQPFAGFATLEEDLTNALLEKINGMSAVPSDDEIYQMTYDMMADLMAEDLNDPQYGEETTITISVVPDEDGVYYISESDMSAIDAALFPM